jgi:hypothetical protein
MLDLFNSSFAPAYAVLIIIAVVAWFKKIPGATNPNLEAIWPAVAIVVGIATQIYYASMNAIPFNQAIGVGIILGLTAAGLYKVADKVGGS